MTRRGFSLLEVIVAMLVLSLAGAALTRTIVAANRAGIVIDRLRQAEQIAGQALEQARAGHVVAALPAGTPWERQVDAIQTTPRLWRLSVEVAHRTDSRISIRLETLAWKP